MSHAVRKRPERKKSEQRAQQNISDCSDEGPTGLAGSHGLTNRLEPGLRQEFGEKLQQQFAEQLNDSD
jgi:hypothetical protein